jgi:predicted naringenin-chalcone synthase
MHEFNGGFIINFKIESLSYISNIATALPPHKYKQTELLEFMSKSYGQENEFNRKLALIYGKSGINHRYSCLPDFQESTNGFSQLRVQDRMQIYRKEAVDLSLRAIKSLNRKTLNDITHIITVSCTGMYAPGLDIDLIVALGLNENTVRSSINFMGCYAAIHGLKWANSIANSEPNSKVLLVSVELCTLHFRNDTHWDQVTACSLFSDGAAACVISSEPEDQSTLDIKGFYSQLALKGQNDMSWNITENGFLMQLSSYIPDLLTEPIQRFIKDGKNNIGVHSINHFGFHPGGRKILDHIEKELYFEKEQMQVSYETLKSYGNMSSPTVLFVLKEIIHKAKQNETIYSAAFGPGLSLESMITSRV